MRNSEAVRGDDRSVIESSPTSEPEEPKNCIELGKELSYEINVHKGMMYLTFTSEGHETLKFTKNLMQSEFGTYSNIPEQIWTLYASIGRDGTERENAYAGKIQYFKQGAYNQTNDKDLEGNIVWSTGSETHDGDIAKQYANGCYTEVWFKEATVGGGTLPNK